MDAIGPYKSILMLSLYMSTGGLIYHLNNAQSIDQDNILFFLDLSFQSPLNNWLFFFNSSRAPIEFKSSTYTIIYCKLDF